MKVLYVLPSQYTADGKLFKQKKAFFPTLTLPYLAGLTPADVQVDIRNDYIEDINPDEKDWDMVGITISTLHSRRGYEIAEMFRKKGVKVVMGGFHATFMPDEALQHCDAVVIGEAESVINTLFDDLKNGNLQKQYKCNELHDLKGLPSPRYDLIPFKKYYYPSIPMQTTRGCPNNCRYCTVTRFYGRRFRLRPVDEVVAEIKRAKKSVGSSLVMFIDDNISAHKKYSYELFEALIPLKIFWVCQCALTMADDPALLKLAVRAGMKGAFIGVETLNAEALRKVDKKINKVEDYASKLKVFRDAGVSVSANMIFGFEQDTEETFKDTYKFIVKNLIYSNPYVLTPYPGTKLYEEMDAAGKLLHKDWSKYTAYQQVVKHDTLPKEKIETLFWDTYLKLYSPLLNFVRIFNRPLRSLLSPVDWFLNIRVYFYNATFKSRSYIKKRLPPYF